MTHRWGFDLSMSAVRLMRREAGHWHEVASTPLGTDDMDQQIRELIEQVPEPRVVDIFLPRDQILYTNVKLSHPDKAEPEIEAAMEGRTPYALSDLKIDWEIGAENTASVAAIASITLSEAEEFADQCGLKVSRFSSLADADDFPRQPDFGFGAAGDASDSTVDDDADTKATAFTTTRADDPPIAVPDEPKAPEASIDTAPEGADESTPVVQVEDAAPVMQVETERPAPLDPGPALPMPRGAPRVRTDLSLPDGGGRAAASLTPPKSIDPHGSSKAGSTSRLRGMGIGLAAVLTAGIALVVWAILPETAEESDISATIPTETIVAAAPPLSDVPPAAQIDLTAVPPAPEFLEETGIALAPLGDGPAPQLAVLLETPSTQSGVRPEPLLPPDTPTSTWMDAPAVLASLSSIPDASGLLFEAPVPPVTRPGNVGLPGVQGFEPGTAPPADDAPAYVPPAPPVIVETPLITPEVETNTPTDQADADTPPEADAAAPETQVAALDDEIVAEPDTSTPESASLDADETATDDIATETPIAPEATAPELPRPTELAAALTDIRPGARPSDFQLEIERQVFGGRTQSELADIRPPGRPASAQLVAEAERGNSQPSALAVSTSPDPQGRPDDMGAIITRSLTLQRERRLAALPTANTTDAVRAALGESNDADVAATNPRNSPRLAIPSNTDVARQATIEDALRLNRLNLVGVFGAPADRRALVRLPTGRYVKVKIGDRIDGGTIAAITEDALQYQKGGRTFQLAMPQG